MDLVGWRPYVVNRIRKLEQEMSTYKKLGSEYEAHNMHEDAKRCSDFCRLHALQVTFLKGVLDREEL